MTESKKFLVDFILKSPLPRQKNHLHGASLEVVMDKFSTLASPNYKNFVVGFKQFIQNGMGCMDSIMALKDHIRFKYVHNNRFLRQFKDKVFVFKMFVDLFGSEVNLVNRMQSGGDMETSWMILTMISTSTIGL